MKRPKPPLATEGASYPNGDRGSFNHVSVCSGASKGFTVWDFRNSSAWILGVAARSQGILHLQIPLDLFGQGNHRAFLPERQ